MWEVPERPTNEDWIRGYQEEHDQCDGTDSRVCSRRGPDQSIASADSSDGTTIYLESDQDVVLHYGIDAGLKIEDASERTLSTYALLDGEEVPFTVRRFNSDRSKVIEEAQGPDARFGAPANFQTFDYIIPAEAFDREGMFELTTYVSFGGPNSARYWGRYRWTIYREGYGKPSHPCFEPSLETKMCPVEMQLAWEEGLASTFMVFPEAALGKGDQPANGVWRFEPGERVTFHMTFTDFRGKGPEKQVAAVPVVSGRPVRKPWFLTAGKNPGSYVASRTNPPFVHARKSFEVTMPEEPGEYTVRVIGWSHPYTPKYELDGSENVGVTNTSPALNTNVVEVKVEPKP